MSFSGRADGRARGEERGVDGARGPSGLVEELRQKAEALNGERWYAMAPPWSGQFVLSGDEDPHVGRFVCCTDATLHMDEEDLEEYRDDDPGERAEFIARCDPATVLTLCDALSASLNRERQMRESLERIRDAETGVGYPNDFGSGYGDCLECDAKQGMARDALARPDDEGDKRGETEGGGV